MTPVERRVIIAAVEWWEMHRPVAWTPSEHLQNPGVNTPTATARMLAEAVAAYLRDREGGAA